MSREVRGAVERAVAAAGFPPGADPGLRPTGIPGQYAVSVAFALGANPSATAAALAAKLAEEPWTEAAPWIKTGPWIKAVEVTGPGYLTITVTPEALAAVAERVTEAGPACVTSAALAGATVPAPPPGDPLAAATWDEARAALAAQLTARLAAAAGATVAASPDEERRRPTPQAQAPSGQVARAVAFAGRDAVMFTLARAIPGKPLRIDPAVIARRAPGNPAYAVRYAHARAASGVRWAVTSRGGDLPYPPLSGREATALPGPPADPGELAVLDALSWLPERVAAAARRGRPDEFARYLEDLASVTVDVLSSARHPGNAAAPGTDRLGLAAAARTGLAAGLDLLGIGAPDRL